MRSVAAFLRGLAPIVFFGAALLGGCGLLPDQIDETSGWSANKLYSEAKDALTEGAYDRAIKYFEKLEARFPYGRYAQQAQLEVAYAYYRQNEPAASIAACDRFIRLHPNHPNVDYAYYLKGLVNFNEDLGLLGYVSMQDLTERDPKAARDSFDAFKVLVTKYPESKYTPDATARMKYLVNALASHEVHVARYYMKREAYVAAVNRAQTAIKTYPDAPANEEALFIMIKAYDLLGMNDLRDDAERVIKQVKSYHPSTEVILITGHASAETAVSAMKEGAFDYITKPLNMDELRIILAKALEKRRLLTENIYLKKQLRDKYGFANIIGNSPAMQNVFKLMQRLIKTDATVLIMGESGTGKEIVAKSIHFNSQRQDKPFVAVHCGAIPETLLESELFGHAKGAFTGAVREKIGKFESANQGTIFLDEIGTMPLHLQIKLLRVLQEQEIERVGSNTTLKLDVRVIAATNVNLENEVKSGRFREDLFYRLNVIPLVVPPLRERKEDIVALVRFFMNKFCAEMKRNPMTINRQALEAMELHDWPGNVRELENAVERLVALTEADAVTIADLPDNIGRQHGGMISFGFELAENGLDLSATVSEIETKIISRALARSQNVKSRAAALLKMNRTTLVEKMKRLGMEG